METSYTVALIEPSKALLVYALKCLKIISVHRRLEWKSHSYMKFLRILLKIEDNKNSKCPYLPTRWLFYNRFCLFLKFKNAVNFGALSAPLRDVVLARWAMSA